MSSNWIQYAKIYSTFAHCAPNSLWPQQFKKLQLGCVWSGKKQGTGQDNFCCILFDSETGHDTGQNRQ
jgi:hypothetical protein